MAGNCNVPARAVNRFVGVDGLVVLGDLNRCRHLTRLIGVLLLLLLGLPDLRRSLQVEINTTESSSVEY